MTTRKLLSVFTFYDNFICAKFPVTEAKQLPAELYDEKDIRHDHLLAHLRWMCQESVKKIMFGGAENIEKAHRWLGYVQGELRALGIFTINQMREHSRSKEGDDAAEEA